MTDNVAITAGTGTSIATDDISSVHYQREKLALGPDGTWTADLAGRDLGSGSGAAYVDPRPKDAAFSVTPTISTSAYAAGDCIGGIQTLTGAARATGLAVIVQSIFVLDKTQAQRAAIDLMFFVGASAPTAAGDNSAAAFSDADMANCRGIVPIGPYNTAFPGTPLNSFSTLAPLGLKISTSGSADLYVQAIVRGTPTYVSTSDLVFMYELDQR